MAATIANQTVKTLVTSKTTIRILSIKTCGNCGWNGDADLNGAINISKLGGVFVSQPGSSELACFLNRDASGLQQDPSIERRGKSKIASAGG